MSEGGHRRRLAAARRCLAERDLDALLVTWPPNVRYLTGFTGSAALLLVTADNAALVTDFRYGAQARSETEGVADVVVERNDLWGALRGLVRSRGIRRLGLERERITLSQAGEVGAIADGEAVPVSGLVEGLRIAKDEREIGAIRAAAALAGEALAEVLAFIRPGRTEYQIAAELEAAVRRRGSEWFPFPSIVASGPRSARPHARSSPREVGRGELLVIDFGAQLDGYCCDITRTFVVGSPADGRQREVYEVVRRAQADARRALRAGLTGREADDLARIPIAAAGFGDAFGHSLGHGLGLEVHEAPRLSQLNQEALPVGAVVTVEPGVYLEGWGGVRIEDDVVLRADGVECLSDGRTELVELT